MIGIWIVLWHAFRLLGMVQAPAALSSAYAEPA